MRPGAHYHQMALPDSSLGDLLVAERPMACVHCAGSASVPLSMESPEIDFRGNTALTFEVLDLLRRQAPGCHFLLLSSAAVYGNPAALPVTEAHSPAPLSPYGYHKWQSELLCEEFSRVYGLPTTSARIFSAYGPGLRRQVVWDICARVLGGGSLMLRGTGSETRDFIHAADVARALELLARLSPGEAELYNLATGREVTIHELAALVTEVLQPDLAVNFDGVVRPGDPLHWRADTTKIAALGFVPLISLEQGVRTVATWASADLSSDG
jgi:UDP-glucose 4-epimerase